MFVLTLGFILLDLKKKTKYINKWADSIAHILIYSSSMKSKAISTE